MNEVSVRDLRNYGGQILNRVEGGETMTINHTPGPWVIGKQDHDVVMVDTTSGTAICDVYGDSDDRPANANLIAKN